MDGRMTCPLDDYLSAITYLLDIRVSLDLLTHPPAPNLTPTATYSGSITYLDIQANVIKFRATQLDGQGPNTTNMVYYTLYISPINGSCKCAVEFDEGSNPAATPENLQIFSQYFEKVVLLSRNETAIQTFILLTRLTAHGATSSIANVMSAQMDTSPLQNCHIQLHMTYMQGNSMPASGRKYSPASMIDLQHVNIMLVVSFKRSRASTSQNFIRFVYNLQTNVVKAGTGTDEDLGSYSNQASSEAQQSGECAIWVLIRTIVERYPNASDRSNSIIQQSQSVQSVQGYPPTQPKSHQMLMNPPSVGGPGGPGGPGSVGPPSAGYSGGPGPGYPGSVQ